MANDVLSDYSREDINHFNRDITQVIRISKEVDRYYGKWHSDMDKYLPKYKKFIEFFNKKYKSIILKVGIGLESIQTRFLLNEKSIKDVFSNVASRIIGLKAVGAGKFDIVDVTDSEGFMKELEKGKNKLHLTYYDPELGTRHVFLSYDNKKKMVELHYDNKQIILGNSPEFKIACFYALREGYNKKIKVHEEGSTFGFDDLLNEKEKAEWLEKLRPRFFE